MAVWFLNPALSRFRAEVNAEYPDRDKASDGTIGDEAHQATVSDHNPDPDGSVDAFDMDVQLDGRGRPVPAAELERLKRVFERHEAASYWIHNDRIGRRANGWKPEPYANYAGPNRNRHDKHIHFNTRQSHERSTRPWGVHVALTVEDADLVGTRLLQRVLGRSGPTVGVALQSGYHLAVQIGEKVEELVAAVLAGLPDSALTRADVEEALRSVLRAGVDTD